MAAVYLLTASGRMQSIDTTQTLNVAVSIRTGNGVESAACVHPGGGTLPGRDGRDYTSHDIGMSLLYLPLTLVPGTTMATDPAKAGTSTARCSRLSSAKTAATRRLSRLASFIPPLVGAALALVFALVLAELGFDDRTAVITSLLVAFTSMLWVYAHVSFDVTPTALLILFCTLWLVRFVRSERAAHLLMASISLAGAVLLRTDSLFFAIPLSIPIGVSIWRKRARDPATSVRTAAAWAGPIAAAIAVNGGYNWLRYGSALNSGHVGDPQTALSHNFLIGFYGQVLSPGKGLVFFSPLAIVALVRWPSFLKEHRTIAVTVGATVLTGLMSHAIFEAWAGDETWGARFTVPILALLFLPLAYAVDAIRKRTADRLERLTVVGLALVGLLIQLSGVLVDYAALDLPRFYDGTYVGNDLRNPMFLRGLSVLARAPFQSQPYPGFTPAREKILRPVRFDTWWMRMGTGFGWDPWSIVVPLVLAGVALACALVLVRRFRAAQALSGRSPEQTRPAAAR